jgi:hypothetical protein
MKAYSIAAGMIALLSWSALNDRPGRTGELSAYESARIALNIATPVSLSAGCVGCPICSGGPGGPHSLTKETNALWLAATSIDAATIVAALQTYPKAIKLNSAHGSVQLYNCVGDIAASIPLSPNLIQTVEAMSAR